MKRGRLAAGALIAAAGAGMLAWSPWQHTAALISAPNTINHRFAAPGRIEGRQPAISVGGGTTGIIREILVNEGSTIIKGQVLAQLECNDLAFEAPEREAEARAMEAHADVVRLGPRREEIEASAADLRLAEARMAEAALARRRSADLVASNAGSRQRLTEAERDERMAAGQRDAANERLKLLKAGARPEEVIQSEAQAEAAKQAHSAALARLARCEIRSPIDGTVLRKVMSVGELVSVTTPQAMFVVADTSLLRIRVEVDEADVDRLAIGQLVTVITTHSQRTHQIGRVVEIGRQMGRRRIMSNDPAERSDRDVLEAMVELDPTKSGATRIPVGLRVSVLFEDLSPPNISQ